MVVKTANFADGIAHEEGDLRGADGKGPEELAEGSTGEEKTPKTAGEEDQWRVPTIAGLLERGKHPEHRVFSAPPSPPVQKQLD